MREETAHYDLSWMPQLLDLCMAIQDHSSILQKAEICLWDKLHASLKEQIDLADIESDLLRAEGEVREMQKLADDAEAAYTDFRSDLMARMMSAARAGERIDRDEATKLLELEINMNLRMEQLDQSTSMLQQKIDSRQEIQKILDSDFVDCIEVASLTEAMIESTAHLTKLRDLFSQIGLHENLLSSNTLGESLGSFASQVERFSWWPEYVRGRPKLSSIQDELSRRQLECPDKYAIDSTPLFSEICIALASSSPQGVELIFSAQESFAGDLTSY